MSETVIFATERSEKLNVVRNQGFIPGVIYRKDKESKNVKFEQKELTTFLRKYAKDSKVNVKINNEVKECIIKKVQKGPVNDQILHIEMQSI